MHKILVFSLLIFLFAVPANGVTDREKFELYNNCKPFGLQIFLIDSSAKREVLRNLIESKLLSARIAYYMTPVDKKVVINEDLAVSVICGVQSSLCSIDSRFTKHGVISYGVSSWAFTWVDRKTTPPGRSSVLSAVSESIDKFIVGYLKVNQKDCK